MAELCAIQLLRYAIHQSCEVGELLDVVETLFDFELVSETIPDVHVCRKLPGNVTTLEQRQLA